MKFISHVVGCMHETRWLMKYIYGSNWPHECSHSTCESNYMDQLWWHQPNWSLKMTLITKVKIKHMVEIDDRWILQSWISQLYELTHGWKMNVMHENHNVK
jgi:hypothetical protein